MTEAAAILESAASFLKLGVKKQWLNYDEEADVLYVSFLVARRRLPTVVWKEI